GLLSRSMELIGEAGAGVVVVINKPMKGIVSRFMQLRAEGKGAGERLAVGLERPVGEGNTAGGKDESGVPLNKAGKERLDLIHRHSTGASNLLAERIEGHGSPEGLHDQADGLGEGATFGGEARGGNPAAVGVGENV
ncbi:MAG: hypothetical protein C4320_09390, partial [Armatimonadota bacterium]